MRNEKSRELTKKVGECYENYKGRYTQAVGDIAKELKITTTQVRYHLNYHFGEPNTSGQKTKAWKEKKYGRHLPLANKIACFCDGSWSKINFEDVLKKFGSSPQCYLTGAPIDLSQPETYNLDHKIPRCRGGQNTLENMGLTTKQANFCKSGLSYEELLNFCRTVLSHHTENLSEK